MKSVQQAIFSVARAAVLSLLTVFLLTACSKSDDNKSGFEGTYVGKFGDEMETPAYHYMLRFKSGGQLERLDQNKTVIATGQWTRNGINVEGYYLFLDDQSKFSFSGLYTDFDGKIIGNWGFGQSKANGGTFDIKKQ